VLCGVATSGIGCPGIRGELNPSSCEEKSRAAAAAIAAGVHQSNEDWQGYLVFLRQQLCVGRPGGRTEGEAWSVLRRMHMDGNGEICSLNLFREGGGARHWPKVDQFPRTRQDTKRKWSGVHTHTGGRRWGHIRTRKGSERVTGTPKLGVAEGVSPDTERR
jgi:hypothetical protein